MGKKYLFLVGLVFLLMFILPVVNASGITLISPKQGQIFTEDEIIIKWDYSNLQEQKVRIYLYDFVGLGQSLIKEVSLSNKQYVWDISKKGIGTYKIKISTLDKSVYGESGQFKIKKVLDVSIGTSPTKVVSLSGGKCSNKGDIYATIDRDFNTYCQLGSYKSDIIYDLGDMKNCNQISVISQPYPPSRFDAFVSEDNQNYISIVDSGMTYTNYPSEPNLDGVYSFPSTDMKYLKLIVYGNSQYGYPEISEVLLKCGLFDGIGTPTTPVLNTMGWVGDIIQSLMDWFNSLFGQ